MLYGFTKTRQNRKAEKTRRSCISSALSLEQCAPWSQQRWRTPARCVCLCWCVSLCVCSSGQALLTLPVALALNTPLWQRGQCLRLRYTAPTASARQDWALLTTRWCSHPTDALWLDKREPPNFIRTLRSVAHVLTLFESLCEWPLAKSSSQSMIVLNLQF